MIKRLAEATAKLVKNAKPTPKRKNRVSVFVYVKGGSDDVLWLSPAFFVDNFPGKDQRFLLETAEKTRLRIAETLFAEVDNNNFSYFGKRNIKGAAPYKNLYAFVLQVSAMYEVPEKLVPYLCRVEEIPLRSRTQSARAEEIASDIRERFAAVAP